MPNDGDLDFIGLPGAVDPSRRTAARNLGRTSGRISPSGDRIARLCQYVRVGTMMIGGNGL